jgi:transcriptional regulator NrdR family protein
MQVISSSGTLDMCAWLFLDVEDFRVPGSRKIDRRYAISSRRWCDRTKVRFSLTAGHDLDIISVRKMA